MNTPTTTREHASTRQDARDEALATWVAVCRPLDWPRLSGCVAWIDSQDRRCGRERTHGWLCARHHGTALRRMDKGRAKARAEDAKRRAEAAAKRPARLEQLARLEAEIRRLDPPPPTTDMAAYGGVGSSAARRYQARYTPEKIHQLAVLHHQAEQLRRLVGTSR